MKEFDAETVRQLLDELKDRLGVKNEVVTGWV